LISLISAGPKNSRRVRLRFSNDLALAAFDPLLYTVTSLDDTAASPNIKAVYAIAGIPSMAELVLGTDLAPDARYRVEVFSVPAVDATITPSGNTETFTFGTPTTTATNVEPKVLDGDTLLYGRDIIFNGHDFQETATGDLATVSGIVNAEAALQRRLTGSPLPYAPSYSPNSREFVDGNDSLTLRNRIRQQAMQDNRVRAVTVTGDIDEDGNFIYTITPKFVGDRISQPISIVVPT